MNTFKNITFQALRATLLALLFSFQVQASEIPNTLELRVDGLVCAFCAQGIERKLKGEDATEAVFVSLADGLVAVALKPGTDIADERLERLLRESGYTLRGVERSEESLDAIRARVRGS